MKITRQPAPPSDRPRIHRSNPYIAVGSSLIVFLSAFYVWLNSGKPVGAQSPGPSSIGQWAPLQTMPFESVHAVLLPATGKILFWPAFALGNNPNIWDPANGNVTALPQASYNIFCAGHSLLPNGQVLITGGDYTTSVGAPNVTIYDPVANTWSDQPDMNAGRWYPTNTNLANGDVLVTEGDIDLTSTDALPQVFQLATYTWRDLTTAQLVLPSYSSMFLTDAGLVFNAGPNQLSRFLNPTGTGAWIKGPYSIFGFRDYGPVVMYDHGKVLKIGGSNPPTATAEIIDINAAVPTWRYTSSMHFPRRQANATILPDGTVLVTGGSSGAGFDDSTNPVLPAELWNPGTETWTIMDSLSVYRGYHSTAVLLPDGRVYSGGGNAASSEVFSPPYLFQGGRPTITSVPSNVVGGQTFFVATPDAASISSVNWISPAATTHTFNENQRFNRLSFTQTADGLNVTTPSNANLAAPGYYMLFLINSSGIPSVGSFVNVSYPSVSQTAIALSVLNITMKTPILVGNTSAAQSITITNLGSSPVAMNGFTFSGPDFAVSSTTCGSSLPGTSSCQVSVVETPTVSGPLSETLSINDSDPGSPQIVSLIGTGTALKGSPSTFNMGTVPLGTASATQATFTLKNVGNGPITLNPPTYSNSEFAVNTATSTCGATLQANSSCIIYTTFTPNAIGAQTGTISVSSSDPSSPAVATLNGVGTAVQLVPNHYTWGSRPINVTTTPQTVTLTNLNSIPLNISSMTITGTNSSNFAIQSTTCGAQVAAGANCSILLTFTPTSIGTFSASLGISDDGGGSPQTFALGGTGGKGITSIALTPATPTLNVGGRQQFTATATYSDGSTASVTTTAAWTSSSATVATVGATTGLATAVSGGATTISATVGTITGSTTLTVAGGSNVSLTPAMLTFKASNIGTATAAQVATLTNSGNSTLTINGRTLSGPDFVISSSTCGASLAAASSCQFSIAEQPTVGGALSETLTVSDSDSSSPQTVTLIGSGKALQASPTSFNLSTVPLGTTGSAQATLTLKNLGSTPITITGLNYSNPEFSKASTSTCGASVPGNSSCIIYSVFTPNATGPQTGTLSITSADPSSPLVATLNGVGTAVQMTPNHYTWGKRSVNTTTPPQALTLTNLSTVPLNISSMAITGTNSSNFAIQSTTCGAQVAAGASCAINITFTPTSVGTFSASLTLIDDGGASPQSYALGGTGQ
jgi:Domain of unknown function (DUF1929)/Bacterial Ig-like domain (group 2)